MAQAHNTQFLLAVVIFAQFGLYVAIRQVVNTLEWLFACKSILANKSSPIAGSRGFQSGRGRKGVLRQKLRNAKTYQEWKEAALTLDDYLGFNDWKKVWFGKLGLAIKAHIFIGGRRPIL